MQLLLKKIKSILNNILANKLRNYVTYFSQTHTTLIIYCILQSIRNYDITIIINIIE